LKCLIASAVDAGLAVDRGDPRDVAARDDEQPPSALEQRPQVGVAVVADRLLRIERRADRVGEARRRAREHQPPDARGLRARPCHRDEAAVRVAEHVDPGEPERLAHRLDVGGVVLEIVGGGRRRARRAASPARVEQQQRALDGELGSMSPK
jgi:hypothetical protein